MLVCFGMSALNCIILDRKPSPWNHCATSQFSAHAIVVLLRWTIDLTELIKSQAHSYTCNGAKRNDHTWLFIIVPQKFTEMDSYKVYIYFRPGLSSTESAS